MGSFLTPIVFSNTFDDFSSSIIPANQVNTQSSSGCCVIARLHTLVDYKFILGVKKAREGNITKENVLNLTSARPNTRYGWFWTKYHHWQLLYKLETGSETVQEINGSSWYHAKDQKETSDTFITTKGREALISIFAFHYDAALALYWTKKGKMLSSMRTKVEISNNIPSNKPIIIMNYRSSKVE